MLIFVSQPAEQPTLAVAMMTEGPVTLVLKQLAVRGEGRGGGEREESA